jgi:hypothetical protein
MALGLLDFGEFITRPFTNPIGWIMIIGLGIYIYLRISGRIGYKKDKGGNSGGGADYVIK